MMNAKNITVGTIYTHVNGEKDVNAFDFFAENKDINDFDASEKLFCELIGLQSQMVKSFEEKYGNWTDFGTIVIQEREVSERFYKGNGWMVVLSLPEEVWGYIEEETKVTAA